MLDKDDDEAGGDESAEKSPSSQRKKQGDEFIDEDKMLDIAEKCFMRIAEAIIT
jgi:hypothetical protein